MRHAKFQLYLKAFFLCFVVTLGVYLNYYVYLPNLKTEVFGDEAGSFFNLWLLENVRFFLNDFNLSHFINTNTFYPENKLVLFWSDNLILPGILYSGLNFIFRDKIYAYNFLTYFTFYAAFFTHFWFFKIIVHHALAPSWLSKKKNWLLFFIVLLFTYNYNFSANRIQYVYHFQNQWSFLVILGCCGLFIFTQKQKKLGFFIVCFAYLFLCYSSLYYALAFATLLLFYALFIYFFYGSKLVFYVIKKYGLCIAFTISLSLPVIFGYFMVMKKEFVQRYLSSDYSHFYLPMKDSYLYNLLKSHHIFIPEHTKESLIYLGFCFCVMAMVTLVYYIFALAYYFVKNKNQRLGAGQKLLCLNFLFLIILYGISFGYSSYFETRFFNFSIYGFLSAFIPGISSLRAVGRFGALGNCILYGIILYFMVKHLLYDQNQKYKKIRSTLFIVFIFLTSVSLIEQKMIPFVEKKPNLSLLTQTQEEKNYFSTKSGNMIVYPLRPGSETMYSMIYFLPFSKIFIVNGCSGRESRFYSKLYLKLSETTFAKSYFRLLTNKNVHYIVVQKWRFSSIDLEKIKKRLINIEFENERFMVFKI